jgi:hypothetical protein
VALAYELDLGPCDLKAWSQNLGHESVLTTLGSYGTLTAAEQVETMGRLATMRPDQRSSQADTVALLRQAIAQIGRPAPT